VKTLIKKFILIFIIFLTAHGISQEISTVFIARNNGFAGSGAPAYIFADYDYLGKLKNKNYITYKTVKKNLRVGIMSNFGLKRAINIQLNPEQPTYVNVNLSKVYVLKNVNNDEKLKKKVIEKINSKKLLVVSFEDKRENLSKYRKRLSKVYEEKLDVSNEVLLQQIEAHDESVNSIANNPQKKNEREKIEDAIVVGIEKEKATQEEKSTGSDTSIKVEATTIDSISVSEIYNKYLAYIDPNKQISSIQSITKIESSATLTIANGSEMKNNFVNLNLRTREGKVVGIMKMPSMNSKTVFDGTGGFTELNNGYKTKLTPQNIKAFKKNSQVYFVEQKTPENASLSVEEFEGEQVYSVTYSLIQNGQQTIVQDYYNTQTYEKIASKNKSSVNGLETSSITVFKDYKDFNGIKRPTKILSQISSKGSSIDTKINSQSTIDYNFNEPFEKYANQPLDDVASNLAAIPKTTIDASSNLLGQSFSTPNSPQIAAETEDELVNSDSFKRLNKREQAYQLMLIKQKKAGSSSTSGFSTTTAPTVESSGERERISKMDAANAGKLKYRRSSLYTMMVDDNTREHYNVIKDAFGNTELSEKFNNHNIGPYLIPAHGMSGEKDQTELIEDYLNANGVARNLVARWFNRNENGHFDMNLIAERGQYNASEIDFKVAQSSMRGKALLSDAGKELISNTFVIVYDYKYTNKAKQAKKRKGFLNAVTTVASFVPGGEDVTNVATLATAASDVVGKGYFVRTTSYLYRLVWNDDIAQEFYNNLWIDENSDDKSKKEAFENTNLFRLEYVGSEVSRNNLQSTIFSSKSNEQLIDIATTKAVDKNIGKLQRSYEQFRVKTPLLSAEPIAAKIGLKEGIEKGDKFEVLEQVLNEDGTTSYERVTTIKVDKRNIWDNTYLAEEAGAETNKPYTVFKGSSNKVAPGMLIRQLK